MHPWHCIFIIIISTGAFIYLHFLDSIEGETEITLEQLNQISSGAVVTDLEENSNNFDGNHTSKSNLSQQILILSSHNNNHSILNLHRSALDGELFLTILNDELDKVQNTKTEILKPFISELHSIDDKTVLSSLFSCVPNAGSLRIICRGHSQKTANLLAEIILRTYQKSLAFEKNESPLLPQLDQYLKKIYDLENEANELKITIHQRLQDDPADSISLMVTNAEILQVDQEMTTLKNYLKEIDFIHRSKLHPLKFLEVKPISEFGQIKELADVLNQLKSLQNDSSLNEFTRGEILKKITETSVNLESEVINAIAHLKSEVESLLIRKKELQQSAVDTIEESRLSISTDPAVSKLEDIRKKLALIKSDFDKKHLEWMTAKKSFSLILESN